MSFDEIMNVIRFYDSKISWCCGVDNRIQIQKGFDFVDYYLTKEEFEKASSLLRKKIINRKKPLHRIEAWECTDFDGEYSEKLYFALCDKRINT